MNTRTFRPNAPAFARQLRDRYLEQFNSGVLADGNQVPPAGKYQVMRAMEAKTPAPMLLEQAA